MSTLINLSVSMRCSAAYLDTSKWIGVPYTDTPRDFFLTLLRVGMNISMMD